MNQTPEMRVACGVISFLCLCAIVLQMVVAAKHDTTTRAIMNEIGILRSEISNHNTATVDRLSTILTEMNVAHSTYKASK